MLDTAVIPDTSKFCLEGSVLYGPFINEAEVMRKVIFSTWCSCWGQTPNSSQGGISTLFAHLGARVSSLTS